MTEVAEIVCVETRLFNLSGRVQGVGFRPFVQRLARQLGLTGWVRNRAGKVELVARGPNSTLDRFTEELIGLAPSFARPVLESVHVLPDGEFSGFTIVESRTSGSSVAEVTPDQSTCEACLAEIDDPAARRYRYPFTNCTQCGPRYTIIEALPYDRARTTMASFALCEECRREYGDSHDRRYHAEPIACPLCGPHLEFVDEAGGSINTNDEALNAAIDALHRGLIVAIKGIGGFHLMCDATSEAAVARLRKAKKRPHKPFAVMVPLRPADDAWTAHRLAEFDTTEEAVLSDPVRPIVLVRKRLGALIARSIAPGVAEIGLMLPYSPLHHLLLQGFGKPVVATSANVSGEPVLTEIDDVRRRLAGCFDAILDHNRKIARPADDSVVRVIAGKPVTLRIGRGMGPLTIKVPYATSSASLACGGQLKATIALSFGNQIVVSPHIGDMGSLRSRHIFEQAAIGLQMLHRAEARHLLHDAHPGFASTRWAKAQGKSAHAIRHHHAHASALLGEHGRLDPALVFAWDGLGLGEEDALWGGETLLGVPGRWQRVGSFRSFQLVGGDQVAFQPWRSACALCWEIGVDWQRTGTGADELHAAWSHGAGSVSSAVGRLFDAAAALLGLIEEASYDGHAPALVESAAHGDMRLEPLPVTEVSGLRVINWEPLVRELLDLKISPGQRAATFHGHLAATILAEAMLSRELHNIAVVGLTGGVFQNRLLADTTVALLEENNFEVLLHQRIPPNDGGLSFGQAVEFAAGTVANAAVS